MKVVREWGVSFLEKSWNYWEKIEIKDADMRILTVFETMFWKLELDFF